MKKRYLENQNNNFQVVYLVEERDEDCIVIDLQLLNRVAVNKNRLFKELPKFD